MGYRKVDQEFWTDEKVMQWDTDTQHLALYLLTNQHSTSEGFYQLKKLYMMADLDWDSERFEEAFTKLLEDGFLKYDETVSIVFLPNTLKYNPPENPNQAVGAVKQLKKLPDTDLIEDFLKQAKEHAPKIIQVLEDSSRELDFNCLPNPSGNGSGKSSPNIRNSNSNPNSNSNTNTYTEERLAQIKKVYQYWLNKCSDINEAQLTKNQKETINTKIEEWSIEMITTAINHYRKIYDSDFYYSHNWTMKTFIKQGNGIPRFVEGLDQKHDGDLWKDYKDKAETNSKQGGSKITWEN